MFNTSFTDGFSDLISFVAWIVAAGVADQAISNICPHTVRRDQHTHIRWYASFIKLCRNVEKATGYRIYTDLKISQHLELQ